MTAVAYIDAQRVEPGDVAAAERRSAAVIARPDSSIASPDVVVRTTTVPSNRSEGFRSAFDRRLGSGRLVDLARYDLLGRLAPYAHAAGVVEALLDEHGEADEVVHELDRLPGTATAVWVTNNRAAAPFDDRALNAGEASPRRVRGLSAVSGAVASYTGRRWLRRTAAAWPRAVLDAARKAGRPRVFLQHGLLLLPPYRRHFLQADGIGGLEDCARHGAALEARTVEELATALVDIRAQRARHLAAGRAALVDHLFAGAVPGAAGRSADAILTAAGGLG